jgi:hypothetical protein
MSTTVLICFAAQSVLNFYFVWWILRLERKLQSYRRHMKETLELQSTADEGDVLARFKSRWD